MDILRFIALILGIVPTAFGSAYKPWFDRPSRYARGSRAHHSVVVDFGADALPDTLLEPVDIDVRPVAPRNKSVALEELGQTTGEMRRTLTRLQDRRGIMSAALADKRAALEEERGRQAYRKMQFESLSEQLPEREAEEAELRRRLQKVRDEMAAEKDKPRRPLGWATMTAVGTADTESGSAKQLVELDAKIKSVQKENAKIQADVDESFLKNSKLRDDVSMMRRRGYAEALDMQEVAANVTAEQEALLNFTQTFASRQATLSATLDRIVAPWVEQWQSMSKGRAPPSLELASLEPQMHMKAFEVMKSFDGKMRSLADEQTCAYDPLLAEERGGSEELRGLYQPDNVESVTPRPAGGTTSSPAVHPHGAPPKADPGASPEDGDEA